MCEDLFKDYEQEFGVLTAEIVAKTNRIPNVHGEEKRKLVNDVQQKFEEAQEFLEQMDLEARGLIDNAKERCGASLKSYKLEIQNLEKTFKKCKIALTDPKMARKELLAGVEGGNSEDPGLRLSDNSERMERSSRWLKEGMRLCAETEEIGKDILNNLHRDREVMRQTRDRLRGTNATLNESSGVHTK